jgi:hypothetical protein
MPRKRDRSPEATLRAVLASLETSDELNHPSHHQAIRALVLEGPYVTKATMRDAARTPHPLASLWRAELVAFLRTLVQTAGHTSYGVLGLHSPPAYSAALIDGRVVLTIDTLSLRDVAILQLQLLLHEVGLRHVRFCVAPDCQHLFVKTYRREYCSSRCQQRHNKQRLRAAERERHARQIQRRRTARMRS